MLNNLDFDASRSRKQLVLVALGAFTVVAIVLALRWQSRPPQRPPRPAALEIAVIGLRSLATSAPRTPAASAAPAVEHIRARTEHPAQPSTSEPPARAKPQPVRAPERPKKLAAPAATAPANRSPPPHRGTPPVPIAPESVPPQADANPRSVLEPNPYVYK